MSICIEGNFHWRDTRIHLSQYDFIPGLRKEHNRSRLVYHATSCSPNYNMVCAITMNVDLMERRLCNWETVDTVVEMKLIPPQICCQGLNSAAKTCRLPDLSIRFGVRGSNEGYIRVHPFLMQRAYRICYPATFPWLLINSQLNDLSFQHNPVPRE